MKRIIKPSMKAFNVAIICCIIGLSSFWGIFITFLNLFDLIKRFPFILLGMIIGSIIITGISLIFYYLDLERREYIFTDKEVIVKYGIISRNKLMIPTSKITNIHLERGWLDRAFGLSCFDIRSASLDEGEMELVGIEKEDAEQVYQEIMEKINCRKLVK